MIVNLRGDILVFRDYRDDVRRAEFAEFSTSLIADKGGRESPVVYHNGTSYFYTKHRDLLLIAATRANPSAALVFQFLFQFLGICRAYFGGELSDQTLRRNFVLVYELLDEVMDYGVPQITEPEILKRYILEGGLRLESLSDFEKLRQITMQATGVNAWRAEGIAHRRNSLWLDVLETVSCVFSKTGQLVRAEVLGAVNVKCELSGMPECKFGLNDRLMLQREGDAASPSVSLSDVKFHQCVRLSKFDKERAITFVPPDGEFVLMNYRISDHLSPPFKLLCLHAHFKGDGDVKMEFKLKLKADFDAAFTAQDVVLTVPVPPQTVSQLSTCGVGKVQFVPEAGNVTWRVKKLQGGREALLRVDLELPAGWTEAAWSRQPIVLSSSVPMLTASGVKVRYLKVIEKSGYKTHKWIRSLVKTGEYVHRL